MPLLVSLLIIFLAIFTQSVAGFGSGLVSMALLPDILGVRTSVPLVAMFTGSLELFLLIRYRAAFNLGPLWRMILTCLIGIPLGVWALRGISERILLPI